MKKISAIFVLLFFCTQIIGQNKTKSKIIALEDFNQSINNTNTLLKYYETLSPVSGNERSYAIIDSVRKDIVARLIIILNNPLILNYNVDSLFNSNELFILKSSDNKVNFFSISNKTGGSFKPYTTLILYRLPKRMVKAEIFNGEASEDLALCIYDQISLVDSVKQCYLVMGNIESCNTCYSTVVISLGIDSNYYHTELITQYEGQLNDLLVFDYNSKLKEFTSEYYTPPIDDDLYNGYIKNSGLHHKFILKYKYLEGRFKQTEKLELWEKRTD